MEIDSNERAPLRAGLTAVGVEAPDCIVGAALISILMEKTDDVRKHSRQAGAGQAA
jgi:hypothetical protein